MNLVVKISPFICKLAVYCLSFLVFFIFVQQPAFARKKVENIDQGLSLDFKHCIKRGSGIHLLLMDCAEQEIQRNRITIEIYNKNIGSKLSAPNRKAFYDSHHRWEENFLANCDRDPNIELFRSDPEGGLELEACIVVGYAKRARWLERRYPTLITASR